jgi:hypothetical protein
VIMRASTQYRDFAEECLRLAKVAKMEHQRQVLHEMAETWTKLAELIKEALGPTSPYRLRVATGLLLLLLFLRKAKPDLRHQVKAGADWVIRGCGCHFQTLFGKVPVLRGPLTQWRPRYFVT